MANAGAHVPTQISYIHNAFNLFFGRNYVHLYTPLYLFIILSFLFSLYLLPLQVPLQPGQSFKFTVLETLDRIKEEFQFLQAQYHSLKLECEKLASEKTEMQRHYIMYYEMSYGLNIEMHKQVRKIILNRWNHYPVEWHLRLR
uniref:Groucho/TLE N-terminal Q-rich domain-containing protein n=1 Tax=Mola mola TaxID=94237 RepID=A0A3Q4BXE0_MOLML